MSGAKKNKKPRAKALVQTAAEMGGRNSINVCWKSDRRKKGRRGQRKGPSQSSGGVRGRRSRKAQLQEGGGKKSIDCPCSSCDLISRASIIYRIYRHPHLHHQTKSHFLSRILVTLSDSKTPTNSDQFVISKSTPQSSNFIFGIHHHQPSLLLAFLVKGVNNRC